MKVVCGLGNPGQKYQNTRHNAGFMFVDQLREFLGWDKYYQVDDWTVDERGRYELCQAKSAGNVKVLLMRPLTFMNESGVAAREVVQYNEVDVNRDFILVHDDLDIELGKFKIQKGVSPKEHNGIRSVERLLMKRDFLRVRIGVDSREGDRSMPGDEYVLEKMSEDELALLSEAVVEAAKKLRVVAEI